MMKNKYTHLSNSFLYVCDGWTMNGWGVRSGWWWRRQQRVGLNLNWPRKGQRIFSHLTQWSSVLFAPLTNSVPVQGHSQLFAHTEMNCCTSVVRCPRPMEEFKDPLSSTVPLWMDWEEPLEGEPGKSSDFKRFSSGLLLGKPFIAGGGGGDKARNTPIYCLPACLPINRTGDHPEFWGPV